MLLAPSLAAGAVYRANYTPADQSSLRAMSSPTGAWFSQTDRLAVLRAYRAVQRPANCSAARFLLVEDWQQQTGMGFSFLTLHTYLLQALWERRTLVFASAFLPNATRRWCDEGSRDFGCYFEAWSPCEAYLRENRAALLAAHGLVGWRPSSDNLRHRLVALFQERDKRRGAMWWCYNTWDNRSAAPAMGRAWWWAITIDLLLRLRPHIQEESAALLRANGVMADDRLIVAIVRHGGKHHEETLLAVEEYMEPLRRLSLPSCLNTTHVFLATETLSVTLEFRKACVRRGWNCFWAPDPTRINARHDMWNPHGYGDRAKTHPDWIAKIGRVSAVNLAVARRGVGLVGSLGSQWLKATLGFMQHFHGHAPSVCSLHVQPLGARSNRIVVPEEYASDRCNATDPQFRLPKCVTRASDGEETSSPRSIQVQV
ncbi:hypothetical protein AB1Y20_021878 [Prymnesium parvum]|uniref:Uncharacterized protein n=1 Tax=Prymnesium parvum TaxID=97485 RepID=A0AB34JMN2_PRYPA